MPSLTIKGVIFCSRGRRRGPSCACGRRAPRVCDFKVTARRTCDTPLCGYCATRVGSDEDLCPEHAAQITLFTFQKGNSPAAVPGSES